MKTFLVLAVASAMGIGLLTAADTAPVPNQNYSYRAGTNTNSHDIDSQLTKAIPAGKHDAPKSKFSPRTTGVASDIYKKGPAAVSPLAPPGAGYGEHDLTAAVPTNNDANTRQNPGTEREFGGLKLFGWDF